MKVGQGEMRLVKIPAGIRPVFIETQVRNHDQNFKITIRNSIEIPTESAQCGPEWTVLGPSSSPSPGPSPDPGTVQRRKMRQQGSRKVCPQNTTLVTEARVRWGTVIFEKPRVLGLALG